MIWAITIATFLGTVFAALSILFVFSRREQIRKALREKRRERRIPIKVGLELSSSNEPLIYERAFTENASRHGVRLIAQKPRNSNDHVNVVVRLPQGDVRSRARIAYCNALAGDAFAIGLRFSTVVEGWATNDETSSHRYGK